MDKKAQGLSLTTIVVAAIVLIVLIVLIGIFTGYFGNFVPSLTAAGKQTCDGEGFDKTKSKCNPETEREIFGNFGNAIEPGKVCCKAIELCSDKPNHECLPSDYTGKPVWRDSCLFCSSGECYATVSSDNRVC